MEELPVLRAGNRDEHPAWHRYFERVYGEPVTAPVDLNTFTWFYHWAPSHPEREVEHNRPRGAVPAGSPWTLTKRPVEGAASLCNLLNPEAALASRGFFVNRPLRELALTAGSRVEVLRVSDLEMDASWFFAVRGSGVFITLPCDIARLPKPPVNDVRLLDGLEGGAAYDWEDSRVELVLRGFVGVGVGRPCVGGLRYSTGWARPAPLRCTDPPGLVMTLCGLTAALAVCLLACRRPAAALAALLVAALLCRNRPRHATYSRQGARGHGSSSDAEGC